jgi:glutamate mutase epsilon subunit
MDVDKEIERRLKKLLPKRKKKGNLRKKEIGELVSKFRPSIEKNHNEEMGKLKNKSDRFKSEKKKLEDNIQIIKKHKKIVKEEDTRYIG